MLERILPHVEKGINSEILTKHIVIIGGGPAGALAACLLARKGVAVDIFEPRSIRKPDAGSKILPCTGCAGLIQENTIDLLSSVGLQIPEAIIQARLENNIVHFPETDETVTIPSRGVTVYRGFAPIIQREGAHIESFDAWLLNEAINAGANHHSSKIKSVNEKDNMVTLITEDNQQFNADVVIGAYGHEGLIQLDGMLKDTHLQKPVSSKGCVREYDLGKETLAKLRNNKHVFANPTSKVWFAAILPKKDHISIVLMGRENVNQRDFNDFLELQGVKDLLGSEIITDKPTCGCTNGITIKSPQNFLAMNGKKELIYVNVGDAGPSRPRVNGIYAALDGAQAIVNNLLQYGNTDEAAKNIQRYMEHQYIWDNYFSEKVLMIFDWILNNTFRKELAISLAHSRIGLINRLTVGTMDYVLSGKGPYWQLPIHVLEEALFN